MSIIYKLTLRSFEYKNYLIDKVCKAIMFTNQGPALEVILAKSVERRMLYNL